MYHFGVLLALSEVFVHRKLGSKAVENLQEKQKKNLIKVAKSLSVAEGGRREERSDECVFLGAGGLRP